ncbi:vacuolar amino acid permease [Clavulina sp. PMI_390]|nr:vacuolar amino acid permease [Clavulina sp. PMI_390]
MSASESTPLLDSNTEEVARQHGFQTSAIIAPIKLPSTPSELFWTLLALWSAVFLSALDSSAVATLISPFGSHFNASHQASYLGTSYLLSVCCFTPLYGRLADIIGRKAAMLMAVTFFGIGTLLCGLANTMSTLIAARAIAGAAPAWEEVEFTLASIRESLPTLLGLKTSPVSSIALADLIPLKQRGLYVGLSSVLFALGSGLGGALGGYANDLFGWRWGFLLQLPILVLSGLLIAFKADIPHTHKPTTLRQKLARVDWVGSISLISFVGSFLVAVTLKTIEELSWRSPSVWALLIISALSMIIFVLAGLFGSAEPILPLHLLFQRTPLSGAISSFAANFVGLSIIYNVPLYFSAVKLQPASQAGAHLLPNAVFIPLGSLFAGWVMKATGKYWVLSVASAATLLSSCMLFARWNEDTMDSEFWFDIVPFGLGISSLFTATLIALTSSVPREDVAIATGIYYLFRTTGQVLGVSMSGALAQSILRAQLHIKIRTPDSAELIDKIRHSTNIIPNLDPELRAIAIASWRIALRGVFIFNAGFAVIALLACIPFQEFDLPSTFTSPVKLAAPRLGEEEQA